MDITLVTPPATTTPLSAEQMPRMPRMPWKRFAAGALLAVSTGLAGLGGPLADTAQARPREGRCYSNAEISNWQSHADSTDSIHAIDTSDPAGQYCNENTVSPRPRPRPRR